MARLVTGGGRKVSRMNERMKHKVLMIAYSFPPRGGGGVQRTLKFVKYLRLFDWEPVVLTVKSRQHELWDDSMIEEIPEGVSTYRTFAVDPLNMYQYFKRWPAPRSFSHAGSTYGKDTGDLLRVMKDIVHCLSVPDTQIGWLPFAVLKGKKIIETENIDCLYSTSAPATAHLIALCLKRWKNLPWVADFRDAWEQHPFAVYQWKLRLKVEERLERAVLQTADRLVTVTSPIAEAMSRKNSQAVQNKFSVITNGYDENDFRDLPLANKTEPDKFTIVYTGSFYDLRTPRFFLEAMKRLLIEKPLLRDQIEAVFAGRWEEKDKEMIGYMGLEDVVKMKGYVTHDESLHLLNNGTALLLILVSNEVGVYTGKIFEYLAVKKPILALVPSSGIAADLIRETKSGIVVDSEDVNAIKNAIFDMYSEYKKGTLAVRNNDSIIQQYERKNLTQQLATLFDGLI